MSIKTIHEFDDLSVLIRQLGFLPLLDSPIAGFSAEEMMQMNWLCENVEGEIPPTWKLGDSAKKTVKISGVKDDKEDA